MKYQHKALTFVDQILEDSGHGKVARGFRWRDRGGEFHDPLQMDTKHLFYTWLMIWNHSAPPHMRIWANHAYVFSDFYTPAYMLRAFRATYYELKTRKDLGYKMAQVVKRIEGFFSPVEGEHALPGDEPRQAIEEGKDA